MAELLAVPTFRKFLFSVIQMSGIMAPATNGFDGRNLDFFEGRRNLGFDILREVDRGQPKPLQHHMSIMTWIAALHEEATQPPKEKPNGRRSDRYSDLSDDGDGAN
mgnify:CR=1 FL=1